MSPNDQAAPHPLHDNDAIIPLEEAVTRPQLHRDMSSLSQTMPNFAATEGGPNGCPMKFWCHWDLQTRPRRIALLMDDCQEEYRDFAQQYGIIPKLEALTKAFRDKRDALNGDGVMAIWSSWSRTFDDGISNAMDRWYGPAGLDPKNYENAVYIYGGKAGMETLKEIKPTDKEVQDGCFYLSKHLDMFWTFTKDGKSYLDEKLKANGIDTVVIAGLWTDECIVATAYAALSRGYDVVVVSDAVATATTNHDIALKVMGGTCGKIVTTEQVVSYMENDFVLGQPGAVKGTKLPDGRKD